MLSFAACATATPPQTALPRAPMDAVLTQVVGDTGYLGAVALVADHGNVVYRTIRRCR